MVGSTDGVPVVVRDQANRSLLAQQRQALVDRIRDEKSRLDPDSENAADWERINQLDEALKGIDKLNETLGKPGSGHFLLGIDSTADSRGRVIVATGNPDTAEHVLTYVPGTTADLGGAAGDVQRNDMLVQRASEMAPEGQEVAGVMWLDYNAPPDLVAASDKTYAFDAGEDLSRFQEGLRATHEGAPSHNTVLGHSYGSTVVGYSQRDHGLHANDVAFIGSPGVGVSEAQDLHMSPEHVWAGTSASDPIEYPHSGDPVEIIRDGWIKGGDPHIHGQDPSDPAFGGRILPTDPTGGHSDYWFKQQSMDSLAKLTVGQTEGMG
ncbi:hypothetical protein HUO13_02460 [Saccharopolyspora erythraea]|nr:hypothetical protein HUO13_02460 [Saccharopolyspora erythraea]